jgi:hypothetical protein
VNPSSTGRRRADGSPPTAPTTIRQRIESVL